MTAGRLSHPVLEKAGEGTEEMEPRSLEASKEGLPRINGEPEQGGVKSPTSLSSHPTTSLAYHCPNPPEAEV